MSKQAENKKNQGWVKECPKCSNCKWFSSEKEPTKWNPNYFNEFNLRCTLGSFKIGKSNYCEKFIDAKKQ